MIKRVKGYEHERFEMDFDELESAPCDESIVIDRKAENKAVVEFQKTGNVELLAPVYEARIGTLWKWAMENYYPSMTCSVEDLFGELRKVFVIAAERYDADRASFNTCLWGFLKNRLKNINSSIHAKKRTSEEYKGPLSGMTLSLDYAYSNNDSGEITLKDIVADRQYLLQGGDNAHTCFMDTLEILAKGDDELKEFLFQVSNGGSVVALIKEAKKQRGYVRLNSSQFRSLNQSETKSEFVSDLLAHKKKIKMPFKLVDYTVVGESKLQYTIEMKKTDKSNMLSKAVRNFKRNKEDYVDRIRGVK